MSKNLRLFMAEYIFTMSAYWACTGFVIAKLTDYFDLPLALSNMLTSLSSMLLLLQPIGGVLYSRLRNKRGYLILLNLLWRISLCFVFFSVYAPAAVGGMVFCLFLSAMQFFQQLVSPAYEEWHVQSAEHEGCSGYYTTREFMFMACYTVIFALVQTVIWQAEKRGILAQGFTVVGGLEMALLVAGTILLFRLPAPVQTSGKQAGFRAITGAFCNKMHNRVIAANAMWCIANVFIGGLFSIYAVRILNVDFFQLMLWGMAGNLLRAVCAPVFAGIAARIGWKNCVANIFFIYMALAAMLFFITAENAWWMVPIYLMISTLPGSGMAVGLMKMRLATSEESARSVYFSAYSLISGGASLAGNLLCSAFLGAIESGGLAVPIQCLFLVGLVLTGVTYLFFKKIPLDLH